MSSLETEVKCRVALDLRTMSLHKFDELDAWNPQLVADAISDQSARGDGPPNGPHGHTGVLGRLPGGQVGSIGNWLGGHILSVKSLGARDVVRPVHPSTRKGRGEPTEKNSKGSSIPIAAGLATGDWK